MTEGIVTPIASSPSSTARGSGGRSIGYGEFGDPNGKPVILFHGFGDSRLTRYPDDELTARLGIRLITFDRPGIGLTDPMKELTILDRTDDVIDLANQLGLHDIHLLGWSGGAPFALAAAGCMAGKVRRAAIVSGFGPFERPGFKRLAPREIKRVMTILKVAPWMANVMATESQKSLEGNAAGAMEASRGLGGSADSSVLNMNGVRANVTGGAEEAFRQGPAGVANDMLLLFRFKWGFNPEDVHTPIDLWYGEDDQMTPPDVGRGLASVLPQPRLRMVPAAGHLLYLRNWEEILRTLVADDAPVTTTTFQAIAPVAPLSPVTETLAAASLSDTTPIAEREHREEKEPVTAQGDVLGSTPAWSWTQPAASQAPAEAPPEEQAEKPLEREPAAYQAGPVAPVEKPAFVPRPRVAPAGGDQLARLRALGFIVDVPEPAAEPEAAEVEPEAAAPAEPEAAAAEAGPEAAGTVAEPEAATPAEPEAAAAEPEPEAEVARPALTLVEPQPAPKRASLTWKQSPVPGLIIGKPRRVAPVEPVAPVAEPTSGPTPETVAPEPVAEAAPVEAEAVAEAAPVDLEAAAELEAVAAEPEAEAFTADTEAAVAAPDTTPFVPGAEALVQEAEPAPEASPARAAGASLDSAEAARLRAAGFFVSDPEEVVEEAAAAAAPDTTPDEQVSVADDELARLRAAGFAPAEAENEPDVAAGEPVAVEEAEVIEEVEAPVAAEPVAEPVSAAAEPEPVTPEVEPEPEAAAPEPEHELVAAEPEDEAVAAETEIEAVAADEREAPAAEEESSPAATELEEEASEAVALPAHDSDAGDRFAGTGFATPRSEPAPGIAASATDAPIMKAVARTPAALQSAGEHIVETGVGWVETLPVDAETAAASRVAAPNGPAEAIAPGGEPAPARDETIERLRAAGFLIGEPRRR
ncbi:MAG: alpha/beta fold hydrolase [Candidatus Dormibacteraeota bacterium]|nr:alpha/beta fold hydrolase [Candidatus Dormibacteraeota bacterium]